MSRTTYPSKKQTKMMTALRRSNEGRSLGICGCGRSKTQGVCTTSVPDMRCRLAGSIQSLLERCDQRDRASYQIIHRRSNISPPLPSLPTVLTCTLCNLMSQARFCSDKAGHGNISCSFPSYRDYSQTLWRNIVLRVNQCRHLPTAFCHYMVCLPTLRHPWICLTVGSSQLQVYSVFLNRTAAFPVV